MVTEQQFSKLYKEYYDRSFRFVSLYVHNDLAAEDIVSESLIKLWETLRTEKIQNTLAFLITILKNKSLDYLRSESRKGKMQEKLTDWHERALAIRIDNLEACNPNAMFSDEIKQILYKTLETLPPQTRQIFILSRIQQKSGKEIAETLNLTVKGVDYHIAKALKVLRVSLKDYLSLLFVIDSGSPFDFF